MGLVIDTDVLVLADRRRAPVDLGRWREYGSAYLSAITASELLVGVHRAQTDEQRNRRNAFVESLLAAIPILPFDLECARVHAQLVASLPRNETIGAHDALIAATASRHGHSVLTNNGRDFRKLAGVAVLDYLPSAEGEVQPTQPRSSDTEPKAGAGQHTVSVPPYGEVAQILARFSKWINWRERNQPDQLENTDWPGIYLITDGPATGVPTIEKRLLYVGETTGHAQSLRQRMNLFERASIDGRANHSGGRTFFDSCRERMTLDSCNVAVLAVPRDEPAFKAYIKYVERLVLLAHVQRFGQLPDCNKD